MTTRLTGPSEGDDQSTYLHRQVIGALGALLPVLVWVIAGVRPADDAATPWHLLSSISGYYHTSGVVAFVAILSALSIFLLMYQGFGNEDGLKDRVTAIIAGISAAGVAFFPTALEHGPHWLKPWVSWTHYGSAAILFSCFMFFSLYLFRKSSGDKPISRGKRLRNAFYAVCGVAIGIFLIWIVIVTVLNHRDQGTRGIFWPEAFALWAFAASWLTKGRADHTVGRLMEYARHPDRIAKDVRQKVRETKGEAAPVSR